MNDPTIVLNIAYAVIIAVALTAVGYTLHRFRRKISDALQPAGRRLRTVAPSLIIPFISLPLVVYLAYAILIVTKMAHYFIWFACQGVHSEVNVFMYEIMCSPGYLFVVLNWHAPAALLSLTILSVLALRKRTRVSTVVACWSAFVLATGSTIILAGTSLCLHFDIKYFGEMLWWI